MLGSCPGNAAYTYLLRRTVAPFHDILRCGGAGSPSRIPAAAVVAYAATPLSSVPPGTSLETPHAPGGLVGTKAQAHNIELVL